MPATVRPELPPLADAAIDAFGSRVRVAIIRSLTRDGPTTQTELSKRLAVSRTLLQVHLRRLEELSVVFVSPSRSEPGRLQRRYHIDSTRVARLHTALAAAMAPRIP